MNNLTNFSHMLAKSTGRCFCVHQEKEPMKPIASTDEQIAKALAAYRQRLLVDGEAFMLLGVPSKVLDPSQVSCNYTGPVRVKS